MCISVPQIAVLAILISTSLWPTLGSGMSLSQMPGAACSLTNAFMAAFPAAAASVNQAQLPADLAEGRERPLELGARMGGGHLRADARLTLRHHRVGEADDVDAALEERIGHAASERRITQHHRDDRMLAGLQAKAGARQPVAEEARVLEQL